MNQFKYPKQQPSEISIKEKKEFEKIVEEKIKLILRYIQQGKDITDNFSEEKASKFMKNVFNIFKNEVYLFDPTDSINEDGINQYIGILENYIIDFKLNNSILSNKLGKNTLSTVNNNFTPNVDLKVDISLSSTISNVNNIANLSNDPEINDLYVMLAEIEKYKNLKDKKSLWEKIKSTTIWILDKSVDVFIAVLP